MTLALLSQSWWGWAATIWPPNLSQFLPDIFNAGVTGAIVAIIVWRFQVRRENREARRRALDDWERFRVPLHAALNESVPLQLLPESLQYSTPAKDLRRFLQPYAIEEWARQLPERPEVAALVALEREWPLLAESQARVWGLIPSAVSAATPSGSAQEPHVEGILATLVRARIAGESIEGPGLTNLRNWGRTAAEIESWVSSALGRHDLTEAVSTLRDRFETTSAAYKVVRRAVQLQIAA